MSARLHRRREAPPLRDHQVQHPIRALVEAPHLVVAEHLDVGLDGFALLHDRLLHRPTLPPVRVLRVTAR